MNHWHPYVKIWAVVVTLFACVYIVGSPIYLIALGSGHPSIQFIGAVMTFAAIGAGVVAIPLFVVGALVILALVRIFKSSKGKGERHAV